MPRFTFVHDEKRYRNDYQKFQCDPGNYRYPIDICQSCAGCLIAEDLAGVTGASLAWCYAQLGPEGIAQREGHWPDDCHPSYEDLGYECAICGNDLTAQDDYLKEVTL